MKYFLYLLLLSPSIAISATSICEMLKLTDCNASKRSLSRSSGASFPSSTSAALNNPAALTMDKGLGLAGIFYGSDNRYSIVTGTGRIGAAISLGPSDETFFGNLALETQNTHRARKVTNMPYDTNNLNLAIGFNLFGKKQKKGFQLDMGLVYKQNELKGSNYLGAGLILSLNKVFSIGVASYSDVLYEDHRDKSVVVYDQYGNATETTFPNDSSSIADVGVKVDTLMLGLKFANFAFDHLTIKTTFDDETIEPTYVKIFNTSFFYKKWILSYGIREEESFREEYIEEEFKTEKFKYDSFLGAQYSIGNNFLVGVFHNFYLLDDVSFGLTYFF